MGNVTNEELRSVTVTHAHQQEASISVARTIASLLATAFFTCSTVVFPSIARADLLAAQDSCVVIDTDFDIDDMMAIPMVIGSRHVAAIVTTEGYTLPPIGASAVNRLVAEPDQRALPIIVGAGIGRPEPEIADVFGSYVLRYRAIMSRLNNFLPTALPPTPREEDYARQVADATADCREVDVLLLAALTSFVSYSPLIRQKINRIVIMGKPPEGDRTEEPGAYSFNCKYDLLSCEKVFHDQLPGLNHTYVDVPYSRCDATPNKPGCQGIVFGPTLAMATALESTGLPNTLKQILLNDAHTWALDTWEESNIGDRFSLLWDQSAALELLDPSLFGPVGGHVETVLSPDDLRNTWAQFTNRVTVYR
ncbi:MAG: nucleoside hydrolase [Mycobacteriaceae bacterium]|nr:nucleoside hydrolase [Mycobacteriaceae bacterium]